MILARIWNSLKFRRKWARLGVRFGRSSGFKLDRVRVNGTWVDLRFPPSEKAVLEHELGVIYSEDCYRFAEVAPRPAAVLDVGGNVGLFSLVARHHFPDATIHCYEPSPALHATLRGHVEPLGVKVFAEAVGDHDGTVAMADEGGSLFGTTVENGAGSVPMIAFDKAVERIGGRVGLLKLDCEGAEWGILEKSAAMDAVRVLTMEFHLWAREGSTLADITALVEKRGFRVLHTDKKPDEQWGMMYATRTNR